ncbi:MAG TPA: group 1 truncated hemoglobin [Dermatophilaceae bacterium]|jgi:hemoglobin|nr:group 1 truncated hemoglobin [Dermatophilaceae bacterium]
MTSIAQPEAATTTAVPNASTARPGSARATIYDRIGGGEAVAAAVSRFYPRLLADPDLAHYFTGTDLARLQRHQRAFLAAALGGPALYAGRDLATAHSHLNVTTASFDKVAGHLVDTLVELNVDSDVISDVVATVAPLRDVVCRA